MLAPGVEIVYGDLAKPETLVAPLQGMDKVFLVTSPDSRQEELQGNFINAAKNVGVQRIVRLSVLSASPDSPSPLVQAHWQTEQQLEASGIPYTHLRPNYFMQSFLFGSASAIKADGVFYAPMQDAKIAIVDVRDIAAVAVTALTEAGHEGKTYEITGSEALSWIECAEKFSAVLGKSVTYVDIPLDKARQGMLASGMSEWMTDSFTEMVKIFRKGQAAEVTNVIAEVACKEPITFDQFVQDYALAFQGE
jgi:uncharacterized protein YbjT (DUF2867 family)